MNEKINETMPTPFELAIGRLSQIKKMIADKTLIEKEDFGVIPGSSKPTLYKPGAQKLMAAFSLASQVKDVNRFARMESANNREKEVVYYRVTVALQNKLSGMHEGEGVGSCNSAEHKYASKSAADMDNTVLKMARKRALVDCVLDATGAGSLFTQDIEDMDLTGDEPRAQAPSRPANHQNGHAQASGTNRAATPQQAPQKQSNEPKRNAMQKLQAMCETNGVCCNSAGQALPNDLHGRLKELRFAMPLTDANLDAAFNLLKGNQAEYSITPEQQAARDALQAGPAPQAVGAALVEDDSDPFLDDEFAPQQPYPAN